MGKVILPITKPTITTFTGYANALAILESQDAALDWTYSQYIRFFVIKVEVADITDVYYPTAGYAPAFFGDFDNRRIANTISDGLFLSREVCPFLNIFEIPNELILSYDRSFASFFKCCLDRSMYVYGHTDISKISVYPYSKESIDHPIMIYGYDDEQELFMFADFINNDTYTFSYCTYSEIDAAFLSSMNTFLPMVKSIAAIQYNPSGSYVFNFPHIQDLVREYIAPDQKQRERFSEYASSFFSPLNWKTSALIGSDAYGFLSDFAKLYVALETMGVESIDIRPFHAFYDHKQMMVKRIKHFINKGYMSSSKLSLLNDYEKVCNLCKTLRTLILKHNVRHMNDILLRVDSLLDETRSIELPLLERLFDL